MKKINFIFLTIVLFTSLNLFSQASSSGSTLTVTDITGNYIYYEYNFTSTGTEVSQFGTGAPLNTPIKIKLSSSSGSVPKFVSGDMHGDCDSYQTGSMNINNTEFITTLNSCCPSKVQIDLLDGKLFWINIKCAPIVSGTGTSCVTYSLSTPCDPTCKIIYCISFSLQTNSIVCKNKNYTVVLGFADGTTTQIIVNFAADTKVFCFTKPITGIVSSNFSNCNACETSPLLKQNSTSIGTVAKDSDRILVTPNPTNSFVKFEGKNLTNYKISIFDSAGNEIIKNSKINQNLNLEKYKPGIYIYVLTDENGYKQEGKIIKE